MTQQIHRGADSPYTVVDKSPICLYVGSYNVACDVTSGHSLWCIMGCEGWETTGATGPTKHSPATWAASYHGRTTGYPEAASSASWADSLWAKTTSGVV